MINKFVLNGDLPDDYTMPCGECGEDVPQNVDACPICNTPVVWRGSKVWRQMFGSPDAAIRRLNRPVPDEDDGLGQWVLDQVGLAGFANASQKKRWDRARRNLPDDLLEEMAREILANTSRRGALPYLLNWADKRIREQSAPKPSVKVRKGTAPIPDMPS